MAHTSIMMQNFFYTYQHQTESQFTKHEYWDTFDCVCVRACACVCACACACACVQPREM